MKARPALLALLRDCRGAGAAEFGLVLILLIPFLLGIVDVGRFMYVTNLATKAAQMGARYAVVTNVLPPELAAADYTGVAACDTDGNPATFESCTNGLQIIKTDALGTLSCTSTSCTCAPANGCPANAAISATAFTGLVDYMANYDPAITAANVTVVFRGSGLGFAGDPTGPDIIPLVTVELSGLTFNPISLFNSVTFDLPSFATTLSDESALGNQSN